MFKEKLVQKNITILLLVQITNYIFPLITIPYLASKLGVHNYGVIAIYTSFLQYATLLIDFGFTFISVRKISVSVDDKNKINEIFSLTIYSKIGIFALLFMTLFFYFLVLGEYSYLNFVLIASITLFFGIFESTWLFQGIEKLTSVSLIGIGSRTISLLSIFILVKEQGDIYQAIFCSSLGTFFSGVASLVLVYKNKYASFMKVSFRDIKRHFSDGFDIFLSNITISVYTTFNTIILGYFAGPSYVGFFSIADKLRFVAQGLLIPVQQALLPRVNRLIHSGGSINDVLKNFGAKFIIFGFVLSLCLYLFGYVFIKMYFGVAFLPSVNILFVLAPLPFIISIAYVYGPWWLVGKGNLKSYRKTYLKYSILHLIYAVPLIYFSHLLGVALSIVITEVLITLSFYRKRNS
ncbi:flippase [Raoultella ornithinolytica]|uniref:flippase n=1 Tax=Raoultella ornithinolytica TaxID=54291 RepID=UPI000A2EA857|nr:flippase [Raoultella ornithinolytica]SMQ89861.1 Putative O-antigen transporter [Raoultella ornithinolytica]